jgi:2-polyprenyl-3-methyl-5-hydroxy-6-metoxy-1,4-benzoquinol methylase
MEAAMTDEHFSETDVARYWDDNAAAWAEEVRRGGDVAREWLNNPAFLAFIGDLRDKRVLDAGCGEGYNTRILARAGARMTGVDISERMIELAREAERREPLGIRYARTSYAELGAFPAGDFDAVVSFMALMDGPRFDAAMKECFRVLRPGGMLAFSLTHPCFITKGSYWIRDEHGVKVKWAVGDYFDPGHWVERWRFTGAPAEAPEFAVPRFDRTLAEYLNAVIDAGFVMRRVEEPRPSEEYCRRYPSQRGWRDHAALFFYVRAEKPRPPIAQPIVAPPTSPSRVG